LLLRASAVSRDSGAITRKQFYSQGASEFSANNDTRRSGGNQKCIKRLKTSQTYPWDEEETGKTFLAQRRRLKSQIRNPKFETNPNVQKGESSKRSILDFEFPFCGFRFVSDFDIRISDFASAVSWRDKHFLSRLSVRKAPHVFVEQLANACDFAGFDSELERTEN
jgi:hypothetical protein